MKKNFITLIAILISGLLNQRSNSVDIIDDFPERMVRGIIRDLISNQPIEGAWINQYSPDPPYLNTTLSDGSYGITATYDSTDLHLFIGKDGYITKDTILHLPAGEEDIDSVNLYLSSR